MIKKYAATLFAMLLIGIGIGMLLSFAHIKNEESVTSIDTEVKQHAYEDALAETLISAIKTFKNVEDASINAETNPLQVNIYMTSTNNLPLEAKEYIEKLVADVYPNSTIECLYFCKVDK